MTRTIVDQHAFRDTLGRFATGIAVICTVEDGEPHGFACQSFTALSLSPPQVLFCPARTSRAWAVIARTRSFAVSVLAGDQRPVSGVFGSKAERKFDAVEWFPAPGSGNPVLAGSLAWVDAEITSVADGGDHEVVIGRVLRVGVADADPGPLLYYRGRYAGALVSDP
ncbi:flavin reductase family protein [Nocardia puris]|uniref:3-hydroxy-9,10-secoandrosta-1,3,5(10)-triene-9, 17-dione monooxygenase reductase component n=1 Tax=Nocardia puris TaxID=208602 RepID=A0A366E2I9_9NOCA|nr:flavin reductase family protein [Nocardia puris]MBF6212650.1 flavin reductase family protein [Nocardia puris]MBF6367588.1 flavin reductase family protein [Nocardia puris]MBF6461239.1 flavin reductase family protein [Nocardia puris]RBO96532.1 3-hydroxy-9,10-secoandrosta-1,3,5(10)-triene-9,17-dione monooxygenase reductase component [Nocardia puris]